MIKSRCPYSPLDIICHSEDPRLEELTSQSPYGEKLVYAAQSAERLLEDIKRGEARAYRFIGITHYETTLHLPNVFLVRAMDYDDSLSNFPYIVIKKNANLQYVPFDEPKELLSLMGKTIYNIDTEEEEKVTTIRNHEEEWFVNEKSPEELFTNYRMAIGSDLIGKRVWM